MDDLRWLQIGVAILGAVTAAWVSWVNLREGF